MTESHILRACLDWLHYRTRGTSVLFWRQNAGVIPTKSGGFRAFVGMKGLPDIWVVLPPEGTLCAVECKMPGKVLSPDQEAFHERLVACGGISCVVHDLSELQEDLDGILPH